MRAYYQALAQIHVLGSHDIVYGELYTEREFDKLGYNRFSSLFRVIRLNQNRTYKFFGVRFPFHNSIYRLKDTCSRFTKWN